MLTHSYPFKWSVSRIIAASKRGLHPSPQNTDRFAPILSARGGGTIFGQAKTENEESGESEIHLDVNRICTEEVSRSAWHQNHQTNRGRMNSLDRVWIESLLCWGLIMVCFNSHWIKDKMSGRLDRSNHPIFCWQSYHRHGIDSLQWFHIYVVWEIKTTFPPYYTDSTHNT